MYFQTHRNLKARKHVYNNEKFDSGFEAAYARELDLRKRAGEIVKWEAHVKIPLVVNNFHICNYYIDFIEHYPDGTIKYVETKGYAFPLWRLKWKIFEALYSEKPGVILEVVKQRDNFKLRKLKKV